MKEPILKYDMPSILAYGDSHMVRLEEWLMLKYDPDNIYGPTPLDQRALSEVVFCAVGGTTFDTVHKKVSGIDVPKHQR